MAISTPGSTISSAAHACTPVGRLFIAAGLGLALCASSALAQTSIKHSTSYAFAVGETSDEDFDEQSGTGVEVLSGAGATAGAQAATNGNATYKSVKVFANASKPRNGQAAATCDSQADLTDVLIIHVPGLPSSASITVTYEIEVEAGMSGGAGCSIGDAFFLSMIAINITSNGTTVYSDQGMIDNDPSAPDVLMNTGKFAVQYEFINNDFETLIISALALADAAGVDGCTANATANVNNTVKWMGVLSVTDASGNPIEDYTLTDEYGNDWTLPKRDEDITGDDAVNVSDLLEIINKWGSCQGCGADIDGNGSVDVVDLLAVINAWDV